MQPEPFLAAVGRVAAAWAHVDETIEILLLQLMECADYKARVVTNSVSGWRKGTAIKKLLRDKFGPNFVGNNSEYAKLWQRVDRLRRERDSVVHAAWREIVVGSDRIEFSYASADTHPTAATLKSRTAEQIAAIATEIEDLQTELENFRLQSGLPPSIDRYALPLDSDLLDPDRSR
jgi:hypothetical protein